MRYEWWRFESHPEWAEPHWNKKKYLWPYAAGIPREVRVIFTPPKWDMPKIKKLEPDVNYRAFFFNPATGKEHDCGPVKPDRTGTWTPPVPPIYQDWVIVLERTK